MKRGQRVAMWLHDKAAKAFLGVTAERPVSRWVLVGKVADPIPEPIGVWVDVEYILERRPEQGGEKQIKYTVNPIRCLIRWDYIITVQLPKDTDKGEVQLPTGQYI
jgi:hypothetical protein